MQITEITWPNMPPDPKPDEASMVRRVRNELGFTQEEFGRLLDQSHRTIKRLEAGAPLPATTALAIVAMAEFLDRLAAITKARKS